MVLCQKYWRQHRFVLVRLSVLCIASIVFMRYATSWDVELTIKNAAAPYFKDESGQSTDSAASITSIRINLFARLLVGRFQYSTRMGLHGRIAIQTVWPSMTRPWSLRGRHSMARP